MENFQIQYQWRNAGGYNFGQPFTPNFRRDFSRPAIYMWRVIKNAGEQKEPIYIGETENLVRRIQCVMAPGAKVKETNTNYRLNKLFKGYVESGRTVALDLADIQEFQINGHWYGGEMLSDPFKRRALEHIILVETANTPRFELLNVLMDDHAMARAAVLSLPPNKIREIARKYAPDFMNKSLLTPKAPIEPKSGW